MTHGSNSTTLHILKKTRILIVRKEDVMHTRPIPPPLVLTVAIDDDKAASVMALVEDYEEHRHPRFLHTEDGTLRITFPYGYHHDNTPLLHQLEHEIRQLGATAVTTETIERTKK
jgi:hypothetical protein